MKKPFLRFIIASSLGLWGVGVLGCASIPGPSGKYAAGTMRFDLQTPQEAPSDGAKLEVRAWYPAVVDAQSARQLQRLISFEPELAKQMAMTFGMPEAAFSGEQTQAFVDAPWAEGRFPVIMFNHGFASFGKQNATEFEDLASHGFVVLSLSHPGDTLLTTYDDGTQVVADRTQPAYQDFERLQQDPEPVLRSYQSSFDELRALEGDPVKHRSALQRLAHAPGFANYEKIVERWVSHTLAVVDQVDQLADGASSPLRGHIDPRKLALYGHSLGGVVMGRVAQLDERAAAVITYDSPMLDYGAPGSEAPRQRVPTCFLYADAVEADGIEYSTARINDGLLRTAPAGSCSVLVRGASHYNFSDLNNTRLLRYFGMLGSVDNVKMAVFLRRFTREYFLHHLAGAARPTTSEDFVEAKWVSSPAG